MTEKKEIEIEHIYELSTEYGFIKRIFIGILLYFLFISNKKLKFKITDKYKEKS